MPLSSPLLIWVAQLATDWSDKELVRQAKTTGSRSARGKGLTSDVPMMCALHTAL